MAALKPAYLLSGDDEPKIDAWRTRVRTRAEAEGGPGALESFDAKVVEPDRVAAAMSMLTFGTEARYYLVDNVEAWKAGDLDPLEKALADPAPDTVLVMIVRGGKPPLARLEKAVIAAGGEARKYEAPKPWKMPQWVSEQSQAIGLRMDSEACKALVAVVGTRQQRLQRELEKLAILAHPHTQITAEQVTRLASGDVSAAVYDLADAVVARDVRAAMRMSEALTAGEDRPSRLVYPIVRRLRDVHRACELLDAGVPEQKVASALKMPPWQAKKTLGAAHKSDRDSLARALCVFADLELELRGAGAGLDEDTAFSLALAKAAA
jgi:DNA polymerase III subunit delta